MKKLIFAVAVPALIIVGVVSRALTDDADDLDPGDGPDVNPSHGRDRMTVHEMSEMIGPNGWAGLPTRFLIELARGESSLKWSSKTNKHRGPWQLAPSSVMDYNRRNGTSFTVEDLHHPRSLPIVRAHFESIVSSYNSVGLTSDHPDFLAFVVAGHNAGYSAKGGLAYVYKMARAAGREMTLENIGDLAAEFGGNSARYLRSKAKQAYWAKVIGWYNATLPDKGDPE